MGLSIYYLVEYGLSVSSADALDKEGFSLIDILYTTSSLILTQSNSLKSLNKAKEIVDSTSFKANKNIFNSIYILSKFNINNKSIDLLLNNNIKSIKKLKKISKKELDIIVGRNSNSFYNKIQKALEKLDNYMMINSREVVSLVILNIISENSESISMLEIVEHLNKEVSFQSYDIYSNLNYLKESKVIEISGGYISIKEWSVFEFLEMPIEDHYLLEERLRNGSTLNAIGKHYGLSRQGIKNKQDKLLRQLPITIEEKKFKDIFTKYDIKLESFCLLFSVNNIVWNYLDIKYKKGKQTELDLIKNEIIPFSNRQEYLDTENLLESFTGDIKSVNKQNIFNEVLFENRKKLVTADVFLELYDSHIKLMKYDNMEIDQSRSIEAIATRSQYVIQSTKGAFRYFDNEIPRTFKDRINEVFDELVGIYGVQKIYDDNFELMFEIELESGDELANLIKRIGINKFPNLYKIHRQSELQLGQHSKQKFLLNKIEEYTGSSIIELVEHLYTEYGLKKESMLAMFSQDYKQYILNDLIMINIEIPNDENFYIKIRNVLTEPIYMIDEFLETIQKFWNEPLIVSQIIVQKVGFNIRGSYVVHSKYSSASAAYHKVITENDIFRVPDTKKFKTMDYFSIIYNLEKNYEIFKIYDYTYMSFSKLSQAGISKKIFSDFIESIYKNVKDWKYFTLPQIINNDFYHELLELGFEDVFYERILSTSDLFTSIAKKTPMLFAVSEKRLKLEMFLSDELFEKESVYISDFIDDISQKYYIKFNREDVKYHLLKYGAFYSPEMDKIYVLKEKYYEEVYGK